VDVFRILLCLGLGLLLWRLQFRSIRPIQDFFLWGVDYPFHFLLTATLILVIWGVVGASFGLQGLFLDEDPLTQVLLGATVMLLFAAIIVHYVALGTSRHGWWTSLHGLASFLRGVNAVTDPSHPVQAVLANGFLEKLTGADIDAIDTAARKYQLAPRNSDARDDTLEVCLRDQLESEAFRMLVTPAVLLEKGFGLVFLVGVVPALIVPLIAGDPMGCLERLPWLIGVCLGDVIGIVLGCWTTSWAAAAADWGENKRAILATIRRQTDDDKAAEHGKDTRPLGRSRPQTPAWLSLLLCFFLIHGVVNLLSPTPWSSRWIDWPERTLIDAPVAAGGNVASRLWVIPWLPLGVLLAEVAAAGLVTVAVSLLPQRLGPAHSRRLARQWRRLCASGIAPLLGVLKDRRLHRAVLLGAVLLSVGSLLATLLVTPEATRSVWLGLRSYASLGAMLFCWLGIFWLATHAATGGGARTRLEQRAAALGLCCLVVLHVLGVPTVFLAPVAAAAVIISGSRTLAGLWQHEPSAWRRPAFAMGLTVAATVSLYAGWLFGLFAVAAGIWLGLAALFLGSTTLAGVAARQPALLYPLTVLLGYSAFAIPYAALDERWQSAMPAAGSIACVAALLAALYTILNVARPRSVLLTIVALLATAILLNGAALFVAPNEFKGSFPHMGPYYAMPVYLDSRDYFRDTTPSTARLRNRVVTEDFDRLARQGVSERLATVYFTMQPLRSRPDGSHAVSIDVEDPRGRLRAMQGDTVRLAAEEWFTIQVDGDDCIALAEEPFYRKIFAWFRYEMLHMVRDGILRGPTYPLMREGDPIGDRRRGLPQLTTYRLITGGDTSREPADAGLLGLRILGLAPRFRQADADYAIISINWSGRVTAARRESRSDIYTVEFEIPSGPEPLDELQLRTMASWMERCHLDVLRPNSPTSSPGETNASRFSLVRSPTSPPGECLVLEDARTEAPVPVGVFLASDSIPDGTHPAFTPYWPVATAIERTIDATPSPTPMPAPQQQGQGDPAAQFTLRPAHDRGLFASSDGAVARSMWEHGEPEQGASVMAALYNAGRLRVGDRLILTWNGRDRSASGPGLKHGGVFELLDLQARPPNDPGELAGTSSPPGAAWARLRAVSHHAVTAAAGVSIETGDDPFLVGQWQRVQLLNNTEVLLSWKNVVGGRWKERKPKLVIVAVSGGGIRASVWTSVVLRKLEATLGSDFPYHIRLITGASGGMVAASYYATSLVPPSEAVLQGGAATFADLHGTNIDDFVNRMAADQLDAVAGRMLFADLPGALSPFARKNDRGRTLEQTWIRWTGGTDSPLGRPLQSYAADERMGWRPSMVYTPMMVEDGRRLLISNLDMAFATRNVGGLLIEPSSRKIERPTIQGGDFDLSIHEEDDVFSLSAVEFFRLFPEAHDFQVTTAVRMSASFPWVSPAINLPTLPPRRVVDAAYYDNYGVNLAALWLSKMSSWLEANTSGVLVVQVRDKVSQGARTEIDFDRLGTADSVIDRLVWHGGSKVIRPGLQALSTPLIGLTNARQWTMAFRNDEQVDLQDLLFDDQRGRDFFRTVVFECPVDVSLNWKLTAREKAILVGGFGRADASPREELARVTDYLTGKDAYEFHKWLIDRRNDESFPKELKRRYDTQLQALGITGTDRLTAQESQSLYENVMKNMKRLELMADWWNEGRADE